MTGPSWRSSTWRSRATSSASAVNGISWPAGAGSTSSNWLMSGAVIGLTSSWVAAAGAVGLASVHRGSRVIPEGQACRRPWWQPPWWLLRLGQIRPACLPVRVASFPGTFLAAGRGAREVLAADSGQRYDACHERDDRRDQQDAVQAGREGCTGDHANGLPGGRGQLADHVPVSPDCTAVAICGPWRDSPGTAATRASTSSCTLMENSVPSSAMPVAIQTRRKEER